MKSQTQPIPAVYSGARHSIAFLEQGLALLHQISDQHYGATLPPVFRSGVGAHVRHVLDHFDCLLGGLKSGRVDYDSRQRSALVEQDRETAIAGIESTIDRLSKINAQPDETALRVKMDSDDGDWTESSLGREFQFLTSHTIHHYAIIAAILSQTGCTLSPGFGISPSTLRHQQA